MVEQTRVGRNMLSKQDGVPPNGRAVLYIQGKGALCSTMP